jgi:hypothetical protein
MPFQEKARRLETTKEPSQSKESLAVMKNKRWPEFSGQRFWCVG